MTANFMMNESAANPADNRNQTTISMKKENKSSTEHDAKTAIEEISYRDENGFEWKMVNIY